MTGQESEVLLFSHRSLRPLWAGQCQGVNICRSDLAVNRKAFNGRPDKVSPQ